MSATELALAIVNAVLAWPLVAIVFLLTQRSSIGHWIKSLREVKVAGQSFSSGIEEKLDSATLNVEIAERSAEASVGELTETAPDRDSGVRQGPSGDAPEGDQSPDSGSSPDGIDAYFHREETWVRMADLGRFGRRHRPQVRQDPAQAILSCWQEVQELLIPLVTGRWRPEGHAMAYSNFTAVALEELNAIGILPIGWLDSYEELRNVVAVARRSRDNLSGFIDRDEAYRFIDLSERLLRTIPAARVWRWADAVRPRREDFEALSPERLGERHTKER